MPRTEQLSQISQNKVYAIDAQVKFIHHKENASTAIVEDNGVQGRIRIPQSFGNIREEIEEGSQYHFGHCFISPNGWIYTRNPDITITPAEHQIPNIEQITSLPDIANNSLTKEGHYETTLLYVVKVNETKNLEKNGKNLSLCILNCYANGYLVDVTLWNEDLDLKEMTGKWFIFGGFRIKKLAEWKFVLVSSVFSRFTLFTEQPKSIPYSPSANYFNLSNVFETRTVAQINNEVREGNKLFSTTQATIIKMETFTYEGCSVCKKKVLDGINCMCMNSVIINYTILKPTLMGENSETLEAAVFDPVIQNQLATIQFPCLAKCLLKSIKRLMPNGEVSESHIITKLEL